MDPHGLGLKPRGEGVYTDPCKGKSILHVGVRRKWRLEHLQLNWPLRRPRTRPDASDDTLNFRSHIRISQLANRNFMLHVHRKLLIQHGSSRISSTPELSAPSLSSFSSLDGIRAMARTVRACSRGEGMRVPHVSLTEDTDTNSFLFRGSAARRHISNETVLALPPLCLLRSTHWPL